MIKDWLDNFEDSDLVSDVVVENLMSRTLPFVFVRNIAVSIIGDAQINNYSFSKSHTKLYVCFENEIIISSSALNARNKTGRI